MLPPAKPPWAPTPRFLYPTPPPSSPASSPPTTPGAAAPTALLPQVRPLRRLPPGELTSLGPHHFVEHVDGLGLLPRLAIALILGWLSYYPDAPWLSAAVALGLVVVNLADPSCRTLLAAKFLPGGCWRSVLPQASLHAYEGWPAWLSPSEFRWLARQHGIRRVPFTRFNFTGHVGHGEMVDVDDLPQVPVGLDPNVFADSALRTTAAALLMRNYSELVSTVRHTSRYAVPERHQYLLQQAGIPLPAPNSESHPHPIHYAYETRSLQVAARIIGARPWYALWMNQAKLNRMRVDHSLPDPGSWYCPSFEGKDIGRFKDSQVVDSAPTSDREVWFAHDVLMYLSAATIGSWFDKHPHLRYLVATAVIPPETLYDVSAQRPELYTFSRDGADLHYVPEDDHSGAYIQPYAAREWLRCSKLITPGNECIHVSLVHTLAAHHVVVFSRPQLLSQDSRVMDMPRLAVIPWHVHPFGSLEARLTQPALLADLTNYAARASATSGRDLYAKVAAYMTQTFGRYDAGHIRAAVLFAGYSRVVDFSSTPRLLDYFALRLAQLIRLPFATSHWLLQSWTSTLYSQGVGRPVIWSVRTRAIAARPTDHLLPGLRGDVCRLWHLPDDYLPPDACAATRFAVFSARASRWMLAKLAWFALRDLLVLAWPYLGPALRAVSWYLDISWQSTPGGLILLLLGLAAGFGAPPVPVYNPMPSIRWWSWQAYVRVWALPCGGHGGPAAKSFFYQLPLFYLLVTCAFPRLSVPGRDWSPEPWATRVICAWIMILARFGIPGARSLLPFHSGECNPASHHVNNPAPDSPDPGPPIDDSPPTASPPTRLSIEPVMPSPGASLRLEPLSPVSTASSDDADPYHKHFGSPASMPFDTWSRVLKASGTPIARALPGQACVWDVLSGALALDRDLLLSNWLAHLAPADRLGFLDGLVPHTDLPRVAAHFGLGMTVYSAQPGPNGQFESHPDYNPSHPPVFQQAARETWPSLVCYLVADEAGSYHLTTLANPDRQVHARNPFPAAPIGYASRTTPMDEIREVLNVAPRNWRQVYQRLHGQLPNIAALSSGLGFAAPGRQPYTPLRSVPVSVEDVSYFMDTRDAATARQLGADLKNHPAELDLRGFDPYTAALSLYSVAKSIEHNLKAGGTGPKVTLHFLAGTAGSGKTTALASWLRARHASTPYNAGNLRFHTWSASLREPLEQVMSREFPFLLSHSFATRYMPLVQPQEGTLVLDDATQLPAGYIQLLLVNNPGLTDLVITCDVAQAANVVGISDSLSRESEPTPAWLSRHSTRYATVVHRYSADVASLFGIPSPTGHSPRRGSVYLVTSVPRGVPLIVVSPRFSETQNKGGQRCLTMNEAQGKTIEGDVAVDLGGLTATATEQLLWTALTRATGNLFLLLGAGLPTSSTLVEQAYGRSQIVSAILAVSSTYQTSIVTSAVDVDHLVARAVHSHLASCLHPAARAAVGLGRPDPVIGKQVDASTRSDWLRNGREDLGDFYTARTHRASKRGGGGVAGPAFSRHAQPKTPFDVPQALELYYPVHADTNFDVPGTGYSLPPPPGFTVRADPALLHEQLSDDSSRELLAGDTINSTVQHVHDGPAAILHHSGSDRVTSALAVNKRIQVGSNPEVLRYDDLRRLQKLKRGFGKFVDVDSMNSSKFNPTAMDSCFSRALGSWVSKRTGAAMDRSLNRDDLDQPLNQTRLFLKGQYIKKEGKRFSQAFPGQIISEFPLTKQFRDAPYALYVEEAIARYKYLSTYWHNRASPDDISAWYRAHWKPGPMTANDYTAWDNGCDHVTAHFVAWVMRCLKLPSAYVELYLWERLHTYSHLGPHQCKQESGDRWTWLANTLVDMAITGASLDCPARTPAGFSGDDSILLGRWGFASDYASTDWKMQPKPQTGPSLEFCGLLFGGSDVTFSSTVILHRAQYGMALGRGDREYWDSIANSIREAGARTHDYDAALSTAQYLLDKARNVFPNLNGTIGHSGYDDDKIGSGWCYLLLLREDARSAAAKQLGYNPLFTAVSAWMEEHTSEFSAAKFQYQIGLAHLDQHPSDYKQAHITHAGAEGLTVRQVLTLSAPSVRLGAEASPDAGFTAPSDEPSQLVLPLQPATGVLRIPVACILPANKKISFVPHTSRGFMAVAAPYESARLLSASFNLTLTGGASSVLMMAITSSSTAPADELAWAQAPFTAYLSGSENTSSTQRVELPRGHPFGPELRASVLGNPRAHFHFQCQADTKCVARITGYLTLQVSGTYPMTALDMHN